MKIMIIGGQTEKDEDLEKIKGVCFEIGKLLRLKKHLLELCSPFEDSADYWVFKGYVTDDSSRVSVNFHYVNVDCVEEKIKELENKNVIINRIPTFVREIQDDKEMKYAWLLCQLEALECSDCIMAIGGKNTGSANMLLRFAEGKRKTVIPFVFTGGAAQLSYERRQYQLTDTFGKDVYCLNDKTCYEKIIEQIDVNKVEINKSFEEKEIFISYARKRPFEADYIETLLRRRGISVFRDESEFGAGKEIPTQIEENIHKANTFIAVYCAEYACSPWCYDELELALDLKDKEQMDIWILCVDDTRIISKRARNLVYYQVPNREDIEGKLLELLLK